MCFPCLLPQMSELPELSCTVSLLTDFESVRPLKTSETGPRGRSSPQKKKKLDGRLTQTLKDFTRKTCTHTYGGATLGLIPQSTRLDSVANRALPLRLHRPLRSMTGRSVCMGSS